MFGNNTRMAAMLLCGLGSAMAAYAQSSPPVVFYSDLASGPNTGGENNNGVIVTIDGQNFGASRGSSTVTVGGGAVADYKSWSNSRVQVALGSAAGSGQITVKVNGQASTCVNRDPGGCNFTVRTGNIYYVSPSGSDSGSGAFTTPWRTLYHAVRSVSPGDTIYAEDGISISSPDGTGWHSALVLSKGNGVITGSNGHPITLAAYPGATVTIGSTSAQSASGDTTIYGLRDAGDITDYVISGLHLRGPDVGADLDGDVRWRVVDNDVTASDSGANIMGAITLREGSYDYFYGNTVHDVGTSSKEGHAVYFSTDNNHVWAGWNKLINNTTCYAMQFHSSPLGSGSGNDMYDLHVHDNLFSGDRCAGLNFATVDPSKGTVEAYNNVFNHVGNGPAPPDGNYNYACIYAAGILNAGPSPSGTVQIYNNTAYDCGSGGASAGSGVVLINDQGSGSSLHYNFVNNILSGKAGEAPYVSFGGNASSGDVSCTNNLFFNNGSAPGFCAAGAVTGDPKFVAPGGDLHIQAGSPAAGAGSGSAVSPWDFDGKTRPSPPAIGAYEVGGSSTPLRPTPPVGVSGTAH